MNQSMTRTVSAVTLAGALALGMSACTQVSGSDKNSSTSSSSASSSSSDSPSSSSSSSDSPSSSSSSSSSASSSSSSDTGSSDSSGDGSSLVTGKVGQDVKTSNMSVKVSKITDPVTSSNDYEKPDSGKHYVGVNVSITNLGDKDLSVSDSCIKVRLTDNTSPRSESVSGYGTDLSFTTLYKGDVATGDVVYQVPSGQKIKTLDVKCDYGDGPTARIAAN